MNSDRAEKNYRKLLQLLSLREKRALRKYGLQRSVEQKFKREVALCHRCVDELLAQQKQFDTDHPSSLQQVVGLSKAGFFENCELWQHWLNFELEKAQFLLNEAIGEHAAECLESRRLRLLWMQEQKKIAVFTEKQRKLEKIRVHRMHISQEF